ncbi:Surface antigen variable number repeat-containing protein [Chitinophaga ginsengisegetis]|uniref:Surface antigen variable number repeat-containing protein n=1 Tax=Chitinophaga ginsengisegetis TaxID=393003 RepID=A0A1T5P5H5_9BACT|nr:POTRA domain-containing protein [Chitinophaga ginsengisegetis]SKD07955.1 Surface antigen variable number repeat-containing protein [Chitinophaga ginsengisegetis]
MLRCCYYLLALVCLLGIVIPENAEGQSVSVMDTSYLVVRNILVSGNKKTRTSIILREISTVPGDTIYLRDLSATLEERRKQLLNTSLFLNVTANVKNWTGNEADLVFEVWERWYTFAYPIFKLADRNFNQWWVEKNHSLSRINLGVSGTQENLTGRNDALNAALQFGYTQRFALQYNIPYIDKRFRHGLGIIASYNRNREVNDSTSNNKQQFFRKDDFLRQVYTIGLNYSYRRAINTRHQVFVNYNYEKVADSVAIINPNYLGKGRTNVRFIDITYRFTYIKADSWVYPLKGFRILAEVGKKGIGSLNDVDDVHFRLNMAKYWQLRPKTFAALGIRSVAKLSNEQPYINQQALGYRDDYLRGLEYYVIDGTSFAILKSTLRQELLSFKVKLPIVPKKFNTVPVRIFAKAFGDAGYAYNKFPGDSFLNNRFLYTGGIGLDIVSFYDTCLRIEYSFNQLGQKGLFLHTSVDM